MTLAPVGQHTPPRDYSKFLRRLPLLSGISPARSLSRVHLAVNPGLYSLEDLMSVKNGDLLKFLQEVSSYKGMYASDKTCLYCIHGGGEQPSIFDTHILCAQRFTASSVSLAVRRFSACVQREEGERGSAGSMLRANVLSSSISLVVFSFVVGDYHPSRTLACSDTRELCCSVFCGQRGDDSRESSRF